MGGLIDRINITDLANSVVTLSTEQNITSLLNFTGDAHIEGDLIVSEERTVDGVDVSDDLVCRDGPEEQFIIRTKSFTRVQMKALTVTHNIICDHVDGVDISELYRQRISLTTAQDINIPWVFGNNTVNDLEVTGLVNGINITEFVEDIMSLTKDQWVTGVKDFNG